MPTLLMGQVFEELGGKGVDDSQREERGGKGVDGHRIPVVDAADDAAGAAGAAGSSADGGAVCIVPGCCL